MSPSTVLTHDHLLYILLDSNLPTGGFVSSSGLESYAKHGFLPLRSYPSTRFHQRSDPAQSPPHPVPPSAKRSTADNVIHFVESEMDNFASTTCPFVCDGWRILDTGVQVPQETLTSGLHAKVQEMLREITTLDRYHESTLLSVVGRRASKAQGVALLTLFTRSLCSITDDVSAGSSEHISGEDGWQGGDHAAKDEQSTELEDDREERRRNGELLSRLVVEEYKRSIRRCTTPGHLAVCWGVIMSALGLDLGTSLHLYLFLHCRSVLSSAVRLNLVGPYASTRLLLSLQGAIDRCVASTLNSTTTSPVNDMIHDNAVSGERDKGDVGINSGWQGWDWTRKAETAPSTTWPLGEILLARHDMQHSRIFNS
ncbi:hypothetical protein M231_07753 [Tremella mesenterica]|uniref:Urease accessory protein UreF n=1 Tax=Tremella mesenterica TaxID=5217 RepID=A0A4Q1B8D5_TREME|nr:hypothetical protein M231_07753 [Tremella mesenterica]